jgi:UDP-N-acetylglucosamine--N-acetylmuramyl-(pentapeptide) pyrophosphoryl-undecaprenol N-acetylglucosamine transferase
VPILAAELLRAGARGLEVRHQTGNGETAPVAAVYAARGVTAAVVTHLEPMAEAYAWADVVVSAAGAVTLAELATAGLPALVVPVAGVAGDHQRANAERFAARTGAPWISEATWNTAGAAGLLARWLAEPGAWGDAAARLRAGADGGAGARVAAAIESAVAASDTATRA